MGSFLYTQEVQMPLDKALILFYLFNTTWVTPRPDLSGNPDFWKSEIRAIPDFRNSELAKLFYTGNDQTSITQVLLGLFQHGFLQCLLCLVHYLHNIIVSCKYLYTMVWFVIYISYTNLKKKYAHERLARIPVIVPEIGS